MRGMKRHVTDDEEVFANHTSNKGLVSRCIKRSQDAAVENNPVRKGANQEGHAPERGHGGRGASWRRLRTLATGEMRVKTLTKHRLWEHARAKRTTAEDEGSQLCCTSGHVRRPRGTFQKSGYHSASARLGTYLRDTKTCFRHRAVRK